MIEDLLKQQTAGVNPETKLPITASYEEIIRLDDYKAIEEFGDQKSDFHVLPLGEHTKEVVTHIKEDEFLKSLNPRIKEITILAAQLHDLGKTTEEGHQDKDGQFAYVDHDKESGRLIRETAPNNFDLQKDEVETIAILAELHTAALNLVGNFKGDQEPKGKQLGAYEKFIDKAKEMPVALSDEEKIKLIFAINKADVLGMSTEELAKSDPKAQKLLETNKENVSTLEEMEKALPALLAAIEGRKAGDQTAGIIYKAGRYLYKKPEPKVPKIEIPAKLKSFNRVLKAKTKEVAAMWENLQQVKENEKDLNKILIEKLGLNEDQQAAVKEALGL